MMGDIVQGDLGKETKYDVDFVDGKVVVKLDYVGAQAEAGIYIKLGLIDLLRKAALKTDNKIDDSLVDMIEKAL